MKKTPVVSNVVRFRSPTRQLRRADLLTAASLLSLGVAMFACIVSFEPENGVRLNFVPPVAGTYATIALLLAAIVANAVALFLRTRNDDHRRDPYTDLNLFIINCGICIVAPIALTAFIVSTFLPGSA